MRFRSALWVATLTALAGCGFHAVGEPSPNADKESDETSLAHGKRNSVSNDNALEALESRIQPPSGYERLRTSPGSYGDWLRKLTVRPGRPDVLLHGGRTKVNQSAHHVVLDIDVGPKDLQQCADAVIRLRAEFLFAGECWDAIRFDFTSGDTARWADWRDGIRPEVSGNTVSWSRTAQPVAGYSNFRDYLDTVFM